jgi:uncharacterized membrane protein
MMGFGLLFWGGLIALVLWLLGIIPPSNKSSKSSDGMSAREILDMRYAQGELTKEKYQEMLDTIQSAFKKVL